MSIPSLLLAVAATALAAEPAYYHPDDISQKSVLFKENSERTQRRFEEMQARLQSTSAALASLDRNVAILGPAAPKSFREWSAETRKQANGQFLALQGFVDTLTLDYSSVFEASLERALPVVGKDLELKKCRARSLPGMSRSTCKGREINQELALALDKDVLLARALAEIQIMEWPGFEIQPMAQAPEPITGSAAFINMDPLVELFFDSRVKAITAAHADAFDDLDASLESDDSSARTQALARAGQERTLYEQDLSELGVQLRVGLQKALPRVARRGEWKEIGLCGNPKALGACQGRDLTEDLLPLLLEERTFVKAMRSSD